MRQLLTTTDSVWELEADYQLDTGWRCLLTARRVSYVGTMLGRHVGDTKNSVGAGDSPSTAFDNAVRDLHNQVKG